MHKHLLAAVLSLAVAMTGASALEAHAKTTFVTIGTGGITGVYYPTGGAIAKIVNAKKDKYDIRATVESTGASVFNINAIMAGDLEFGIAQADRQYQAYNGLSEWEGKPQKDLRAVFALAPEAVTFVAAEDSGIKSLKVGYNKVFGYYIEVSKSYYDQVPDTYIRKQTLTNCERFITQELKELEHEILSAQDRITALEFELFCDLREQAAAQVGRIQRSAAAVAQVDVLSSFAAVAAEQGYCRPEVDLSDAIEITEGRHPVVEKMLKHALFVPNDTHMDNRDDTVAIITGPNMAGKSTYMRQVALIVLMAQMGSFVPAASARIGVVDRIFTRIGASDDLSAGQSTFMVEMTEVADILRHATKHSLLILDEIGRGTSTFDGMSIARAVLEYCADKKLLGAKTLFATHYHELTELENTLPGTVNYNIAVKTRGEDIIFLRKILPGGADRSYGIEVAKLAGLPDKVVQRAKTVLKELEEENGVQYVAARKEEDQVSLTAIGEGEVLDALRRCQPDTLTPIEAMSLIYEWKQKLN